MMLRSVFKRLLTLIGAFLFLTLSVDTVAAHAATAGATAYQNRVISAAMARMPGGTRVSAGEITWDGGGVFLVVPADAGAPSITATDPSAPDSMSQCPFGFFCAWSDPGFGGCFAGVRTGAVPNFWFDWGLFSAENCGSRGTWSWFNNSDFRGWKEQFHSGGVQLDRYTWQGGTGSGANRCVSPGRSNSDVTNFQDRVDGWMQGSNNPAPC